MLVASYAVRAPAGGPALLALVASSLLVPALSMPLAASAQVEAAAVLEGRAFVADSAMRTGTVVLHLVTDAEQGELDSTAVRPDGAFSFRLPRVPDPARGEVYFASIRHAGVLYFGQAVTTAAQLDSLYEIHAYDTLLAPAEGANLVVQARNLFLEPEGDAWRVTDVFQLRNDRDRTIVAREDGRVWSYPLPAEARDPQPGQGDLSLDPTSFEDGSVVVRAAVPPGERLFVLRYTVDEPFLTLPTPGTTETLDVLVREPAPPLEVVGLAPVEPVELEPGTTYRRFATDDLTAASVELREGQGGGGPPVQWIAVALAFVLATAGLYALRAAPAPAPVPAPVGGPSGGRSVPSPSSAGILLEVARLDEEFEALIDPSADAVRAYRRRRSELIGRLRALG